MTLILGFAPFLLFWILSRLSADLALWAAFAAAFVVTIRDFVERPVLRLLDVASLVLFGVLALSRAFLAPEMSLAGVRIVVEALLALVIAWSLFRGRPFSMEYASGETAGQAWPMSAFIRVNYVISSAWMLGFVAIIAADVAMSLLGLPSYAGVALSLLALVLAGGLTLAYPAAAARKLGSGL